MRHHGPSIPSGSRSSSSLAVRRHRVRTLVGATLGILLLGATPSLGQSLSEEERVTVIDVMLSFERSPAAEWARSRSSPEGLGADDFTVLVDGEEQSVVGVQALEDSVDGSVGWSQLVYVDCRMTSQPHLRWALSALSARAEELVSRGPVDVVVADPAPRTLLSDSRDAAVLAPVLAQLAERDDCRDLLPALRDEALESDAGAKTSRSAEQNLTTSSSLALITRLTDGLRREGGAQKALYLVHGGFDPDADSFYGGLSAKEAGAGAAAPGEDGSEPANDARRGDDRDQLPALVASYGWTVVELLPSREPERDGAYIGSWYFTGATGAGNPEKTALEEQMELPDSGGQPVDDGDPWQSFLGGIRGKLNENKDAGKAESYLELGQALYGQGRYERAAESFEKALYHFADAPATRDRQTLVLVQLGNALAAAGERDRARRAVEAALDREPELAQRAGAETVGLENRGHRELVAATDGASATSPAELDDALDDLDRKVRLTYQIEGDPTGELLPLEVRYSGDVALGHAGWTRSSTPAVLARHRALRLTDDELRDATHDDGGIDLAAARTDDGGVDLRQAFATAGLDAPEPRVFVAPGTAAGGLQAPLRQTSADEGGILRVTVPEDADFVVVVVDDLESGAWGAALFGG